MRSVLFQCPETGCGQTSGSTVYHWLMRATNQLFEAEWKAGPTNRGLEFRFENPLWNRHGCLRQWSRAQSRTLVRLADYVFDLVPGRRLYFLGSAIWSASPHPAVTWYCRGITAGV